MSLIKCSECGKEISQNAQTCPSCGNPVAQAKTFTEGPVTTIQKTYKKWKAVRLASWVVIIIGLISLTGNEVATSIGSIGIVFGIIGLIVARLGAWWTTG